jgi:anti-sigma factor RsiW
MVMDAKLIAERHVIERYLAGQLSDAEADAFEVLLEEQPDLARDVERIARMKTGFAVLERNGELAQLLARREAPRARTVAWIAAAAALLLALGFVAFRNTGTTPPVLLATSLKALSPPGAPVPLRASVALARARGMGADAELVSSGAESGAAQLELATGGRAAATYAIELLTLDADGARTVASIPAIAADEAGVVRLYISLQGMSRHGLAPGDYLLRLTPTDASAPVEYSLALRPPH